MSQTTLDFIEHFGVRGMKWGIRKKKVSRGSSGDHRNTSPLRNRRPSELTNRQLRISNERVNLEQNYKRLNPSKITIGANVVRSLLAVLGTAASFYALTQSPAGKAAISLGSNFMKKRV